MGRGQRGHHIHTHTHTLHITRQAALQWTLFSCKCLLNRGMEVRGQKMKKDWSHIFVALEQFVQFVIKLIYKENEREGVKCLAHKHLDKFHGC